MDPPSAAPMSLCSLLQRSGLTELSLWKNRAQVPHTAVVRINEAIQGSNNSPLCPISISQLSGHTEAQPLSSLTRPPLPLPMPPGSSFLNTGQSLRLHCHLLLGSCIWKISVWTFQIWVFDLHQNDLDVMLKNRNFWIPPFPEPRALHS